MPSLSSFIVLLIFCISLLHPCNCRNLRVEINEGHEKQLQYLNEVTNQNDIITISPNTDQSFSNKLDQEAERGSKVKQIRVNDDHKPKKINFEAIRKEIVKVERMLRSKDSVLHGHESLVSVSFRVPRNNEGLDQHPEFNLDYAPPKTHPPIHN